MIDPLPSQTAGVVDPEGAAAADANRTPDCAHPSVTKCGYVNCAFCGVWCVNGKVRDRGGAHLHIG